MKKRTVKPVSELSKAFADVHSDDKNKEHGMFVVTKDWNT